jgi:hypothetical protein
MYCKCSSRIPELRLSLGYKTCVQCSTEVRWSGVPVINHKTGNEIQIVKDPEVAAEFLAQSARVGFGTLRGMSSSYRKPSNIISKIKEIPDKPVPSTIVSRTILPNEFETVGTEVIHILESSGTESAYNHIEKSLTERRIFRNHANQLRSIIQELTKIHEIKTTAN